VHFSNFGDWEWRSERQWRFGATRDPSASVGTTE
jgi:hypothetical protein